MPLKLYTYFRSSAAYRVRIALNLKSLAYESVPRSLLQPQAWTQEYRQVNPQGLLPALQDDGAVLSQSLAIIEYLEERHPHPALLPAEPVARAHVRSMALAIACDIHPLNNLRVLKHLRGLGQDDAGVADWYRHWISVGFAGLETQVRQHSSAQRHCFGDAPTLADVCLVPQLYNARRFDTDLSAFPTLVAIGEHLDSLPAFAEARPEVQPDAPA